MHLLTIVFGPACINWSLMFKDPQRADKAFADLEVAKQSDGTCITIIDDFGQKAVLEVLDIHGWMLEDMEQSKMCHIERGLHQARTQARGQQMAQSDPILKNASAMRGPAVLDPMANGRFS